MTDCRGEFFLVNLSARQVEEQDEEEGHSMIFGLDGSMINVLFNPWMSFNIRTRFILPQPLCNLTANLNAARLESDIMVIIAIPAYLLLITTSVGWRTYADTLSTQPATPKVFLRPISQPNSYAQFL